MGVNPSRPSATGLRATGIIAAPEAPAKLDGKTGSPAAIRLDEDPAAGSGAFSSAICWPRQLAQNNAINTGPLHRFLIHPVHRSSRS